MSKEELGMQQQKLEMLTGEVFERIAKQWMLITAGPVEHLSLIHI